MSQSLTWSLSVVTAAYSSPQYSSQITNVTVTTGKTHWHNRTIYHD